MIFDALVIGALRSAAWRSLVTVLAVALGVATLVAIALANTAVQRSASSDALLLAAPVDLQVRGQGRGLDERLFAHVKDVPGVADARPVIEGNALLGTVSVGVVGIDALAPLPGVGGFAQRMAGAFAPHAAPLEPRTMLEDRGAVVSARIARRFGLRAGLPFTVHVGARTEALLVAAVLPATATGVDSNAIFVDVATAQALFETYGVLDRIDLTVDQPRETVRARIARLLPTGTHADVPGPATAHESAGALARLLQEFGTDFRVLAIIALALAATLVYGAVGTSVTARRAEIAILRGLGATRRQIFGAFVTEGALYGALGSLAGVVLGSLCAQYVLAAVAPHAPGSADVTLDTSVVELVRGFAIGVALATISALLPARAAMRVPPAQAMNARGFEGPSLIPWHAALRSARPFAAIRGWPPFALLAATNVAAAPKRSSIAVAALAVALGATLGFAIANASLRTALGTWARESMPADLVVRSQTRATFDVHAIARAARVAGVTRIDAARALSVAFGDRFVTLYGDDALDADARLTTSNAPLNEPGGFPAIVGAPLAAQAGLRVGDRFALAAPGGRLLLRVAAIRDDFTDPGGSLRVARSLVARYYRAPGADALEVYLRRGAASSDVRTALVHALAPLGVSIATTAELRAQALGVFDRTFAIANSLGAISLVIALGGIATTLGALVLERRREIGLLRYTGATRATIRAMVVGEGALLGIAGSILGCAFGMGLAAIELGVVDGRLFGRTIAIDIPPGIVAATVVLTFAAVLLAALVPARLAATIATDAARTAA